MLKINEISKSFNDNLILDNLSFTFLDKKIYGLIGKNGEGKTTLVNILTNVLLPDNGEIIYNDKLLKLDKSNDIDLLNYKKDIAYSTDESASLEYLTPLEYFSFINSIFNSDIKNKSDKKKNIELLNKKVEEAANLLDFTSYLNKVIALLSHGNKQKVSLISSYIHNPKIWFLDEPFLGLDINGKKGLIKLIKKLKEENNSTIILIIHDIEEAFKLCDEILLLNDKNISKSYDLDMLNHDSNNINNKKEIINKYISEVNSLL